MYSIVPAEMLYLFFTVIAVIPTATTARQHRQQNHNINLPAHHSVSASYNNPAQTYHAVLP